MRTVISQGGVISEEAIGMMRPNFEAKSGVEPGLQIILFLVLGGMGCSDRMSW